MDSQNPNIAELEQLLWRMRDGVIDGAGLTRIETLVTGDAEVRRFYIRYSTLCGGLRWLNTGDMGRGDAGFGARDSGVGGCERVTLPSSFILSPSSLSPFPSPLSPSFVGGPVFSYMVATFILGLMLFGAWAYTITHDQHGNYVQQNSRGLTAPGRSTQQPPELIFVGRVTGMKDCRWSDPQTEHNMGASVRLGRRYALASGLMEITYLSGAKVILQGPCTYIVDSDAGGFLSRGKLTARVESAKPQAAKPQGPRPKTQDQNPQIPSSFIPHPSSFVVRTPTAIVTDLGTEFGVEVGKNGDTTSHVFRGAVKVRIVGGDGEQGNLETVLRENESAQVERDANQVVAVRKTAVNPDAFTRRMPDPPPVILFHDTFDNQADSTTFGEAGGYGLNECLSTRQSGVYRRVHYFRGGDFSVTPSMTQVNHAVCPGKLNLIADHGQAGWVSLNCNFPRNVEVTVELDPAALRCADKSPLPKTVQGDPASESWMALGIRGQDRQLDHRELPLASNAGAAIQVRANGRWAYYENGAPIAEGRVAPARPYRVAIRAVGERLDIQINGSVIDLDANGPGTTRMLQALSSETNNNFISIGTCNTDATTPSGGTDINSVDNLTVRSARPSSDAPTPQQKGEQPPNSP